MKNGWLWLNLFLSIELSSGCAVAMGNRRSCDSDPLPVRPIAEVCILNGDGSGSCYDPRVSSSGYVRKMVTNDICTNSKDYFTQEAWIKEILK